jgi:hypothetical protein
MKNLSKKLVLGAVVVCLVSTSAMAQKGKYFNEYAYGDSPREARYEAKKRAELTCTGIIRKGIAHVNYSEPEKEGREFVVHYEGRCNGK